MNNDLHILRIRKNWIKKRNFYYYKRKMFKYLALTYLNIFKGRQHTLNKQNFNLR